MGSQEGIGIGRGGEEISDLVAQARQGNRAAQERLVQWLLPCIRRELERRTKSREDQEDILQDWALAFPVALQRFRGHASISTFAYAVVRRMVLARGRKNAREAVRLDRLGLLEPHVMAALHEPEEALDRLARDAALQKLITDLPEPYGNTVRLYYYQAYSLEEIALEINAPVSTVRHRLKAARKRLRNAITRDPLLEKVLKTF